MGSVITMRYTDYGAIILEDDDMIVASEERVTAPCRCCGEESTVIKTTAITGYVRYSKCGYCYM